VTFGGKTYRLGLARIEMLPIESLGKPVLPSWLSETPEITVEYTWSLFDANLGYRGTVLVDGLKRPRVKRGVKGVNGWVEQCVTDSRGALVIRNGEILTRIIRGVVTLLP